MFSQKKIFLPFFSTTASLKTATDKVRLKRKLQKIGNDFVLKPNLSIIN